MALTACKHLLILVFITCCCRNNTVTYGEWDAICTKNHEWDRAVPARASFHWELWSSDETRAIWQFLASNCSRDLSARLQRWQTHKHVCTQDEFAFAATINRQISVRSWKHRTYQRFAKGSLSLAPWRNNVYSSVIDCRVFPKPLGCKNCNAYDLEIRKSFLSTGYQTHWHVILVKRQSQRPRGKEVKMLVECCDQQHRYREWRLVYVQM